MHQQRAGLRRLAGQHLGSQRIEQPRLFRLAFGLVHGRVGGGIDDDIGTQSAHGPCEFIEAREIAAQALATGVALALQRDQLAQRRQAALQLPAHLSIAAQQQQLHAPAPSVYWRLTHSR